MPAAPNYIAFAIPVFFVLIGIEFAISSSRGKAERVYRSNDTIADLGCGIGQQAVGIFFAAWVLAAYASVYDRYAPIHLSAGSVWTWMGCFLLVDLIYYAWHRASHRVNILWAAHVVHHQSEEYNLAVALRQAWFTSLTSLPFYLTLALAGFPFSVFATNLAISTLYQFWIHTRLIGNLGPLEWFLNTPSHHRVHHAINPNYVDRNYAAVLIVWDRIFGTFRQETEPPVFGTVRPFTSWNCIWANLEYPVRLLRESLRARGIRNALGYFLAGPERRVDGGIDVVPAAHSTASRRFETTTSRRSMTYVWINLACIVAGLFLLLVRQETLSSPFRALAVFLILLSTAILGGVLENRRWVSAAEIARTLLVVALVLASG